MNFKSLFLLLALVILFSIGCKQESKKQLPKGPEFSSILTPDDEGTVKPINKRSAKLIKIAVIGLENNPFWIPVKEACNKATEELKNFNCQVDWIIPQSDNPAPEEISSIIDSCISGKYNAIATVAWDKSIASVIDKAVAAGIPVATFNNETEVKNSRLFFVGADWYKQGESAAENMIKVLNGHGSKIAIINGSSSVEINVLRKNGFIDYIKKNAPIIQVAEEVENKDDYKLVKIQTKEFIKKYPDLAAIYIVSNGAFGAARAVEESDKGGKIKIICFDLVDETMEYVKTGIISGTISQDLYAQGHDPAIRLYNYLVGKIVPPAGKLITKAEFVTSDNIDKFWVKSK